MGVTEVLAGRAVRRAHVLTVEVPGWWLARARVESAAVARGWQLATSPADADVLAVCGPPGDGLAAAVERVWQQLPGPRARVEVAGTDLGAAETALTRAAELLQTTGASDTPADHVPPGQHDGHDAGHGAGHDSAMHGDMAPAGIPLAEGADDRDGLEMDVLAVPLGPILPCWPGGLVLRCRLHGDVVAEATVDTLPAAAAPADLPAAATAVAVARRHDAAGQLLELAGWDDAATAARRLRDRLLAGEAPERVGTDAGRLHQRVSRSRTLRWSLTAEVRDRLLGMLDGTVEAGPAGAALEMLPGRVAGLDLAGVRLVVAGLALDLSSAAADA